MRTRGQQVREVGSSIQYLLEVVQEQRHLSPCQIVLHMRQPGMVADRSQAQCLGEARYDALWITEGSERHEADSISKDIPQSTRDLKTQACFAHPSNPDEGEQAYLRALQEGTDLRYLTLAANQWRGGEREFLYGDLPGNSGLIGQKRDALTLHQYLVSTATASHRTKDLSLHLSPTGSST